ncbi:MAG: hypothetical protein VYD19_02840 [Myxococcota bacterium]|nr:hypothetical protein [Myxococcota bacterium]
MELSLIIANFCLGLFVGALAYSPLAPAEKARAAFRNAWYIGVVFVGLAFFDQLIRSASARSEGQLTFVFVGIALGLFLNRQLSRNAADQMPPVPGPSQSSAQRTEPRQETPSPSSVEGADEEREEHTAANAPARTQKKGGKGKKRKKKSRR